MNRDSLPHDSLAHDERRARRPNTTRRLTRSRHDRVLTGVLGGIAEYVGANPRTVRALFAAATLLSGGVLGVGYLLLWWLLPVGQP
jgi:phage shock protein C